MRIAGFTSILFALLALGCGSVQEHRARQMKREFSPLSDEQKAQVLAGRIAHGFTMTMVYIALGTPKETRRLENGVEEWTYVGWLEPEGRFLTTSEMIFRSASTMQQLTVTFQDGNVHAYEVAPIAD